MSVVSTDTLWEAVVYDTGLMTQEDGPVRTQYRVESLDGSAGSQELMLCASI